MTDWFLRYDTRLKQRARDNRKNPTPAEQKAWDELFSKKQFHGYKFTRQKMLSWFIVDFYCSELQLVVEIDWEVHSWREEFDDERTIELEKLWLRIIRYDNYKILNNMDWVNNKLTKFISPH